MNKRSIPELNDVHRQWSPAEPTEVFETYWHFAAKRQELFFNKALGLSSPWTEDTILQTYKFTNAYRASDRVSQYLIRHVIYTGSQETEEVFFRTILFKIFNRIETWELMSEAVGGITWHDYKHSAYEKVLSRAMAKGKSIYSAAYMMPSGSSQFGSPRKHINHLRLLESMMKEDLPEKILQEEQKLILFLINLMRTLVFGRIGQLVNFLLM